MHDSKEQLVRDTIDFLKQEGWIQKLEKRAPLKPTPLATPTAPIIKEPLAQETKKASFTRRSSPTTEHNKSPLLLDAIAKHLPHISLTQSVPPMQKVAIFYEDEGELPFWKNLKTAIEQRFCPCELLSSEQERDLRSYVCILAPSPKRHPHQIPLAKATVYLENIQEKRALWSLICNTLSPKSS